MSATSEFIWEPFDRSMYQQHSRALRAPLSTRFPAFSHPLKPTVILTKSSAALKNNDNNKKTSVTTAILPFADPLGCFESNNNDGSTGKFSSNQDFKNLDPLSEIALKESAAKTVKMESFSEDSDYHRKLVLASGWKGRKQKILEKYTTSEKLSIITCLDGVHQDSAQIAVSNKTSHRLEQLDMLESGGGVKKFLDLTQQEFVGKINELRGNLISAWESDLRVESIKIAIQCAKLLGDVSVIRFYPSKFVLITDILDTFGNLVYGRLFSKASSLCKNSLSSDFAANEIPDGPKETCKNWFFKVASIRELIPRFYVELAILKSLRFIKSEPFESALSRLANMSRGIAHPLVASYARCYLARIALEVKPFVASPLVQALQDTMEFGPTLSARLSVDLANQRTGLAKSKSGLNDRETVMTYLALFEPAIDWLVYALAQGPDCTEERFLDVLNLYLKRKMGSEVISNGVADLPNGGPENQNHQTKEPAFLVKSGFYNLLLLALFGNFPAKYFAGRAFEALKLIGESSANASVQCGLLASLGEALCKVDPTDDRRKVLERAWRLIGELEPPNPHNFVKASMPWFAFTCQNFGPTQVNKLLGKLIETLTPDKAFESFYPELKGLLLSMLDKLHPVGILFQMSNFLPFLDLLQKEQVQVEACLAILETFNQTQLSLSHDVTLAGNIVLTVGKNLHDSLSALSTSDELRNVSSLICRTLNKFNFGSDFEQQLSFYMEARGAFCNLDDVTAHLVHCTNGLALSTLPNIRQNSATHAHNSKKRRNFVRACAAYAYISIPSIQDIHCQLQLYLESAQVSLQNGCLPQTDAFLKSCISQILDYPLTVKIPGTLTKTKSNEPLLADFIWDLMGFLLVVPDVPGKGVLYLFKGLLNAVGRIRWTDLECKIKTLISALAWLAVASLPEYPYKIEGVVSNDALYGGSLEFLSELKSIGTELTNQILTELKTLGREKQQRKQSALSLNFAETLIKFSNVENPNIASLVVNLCKLAKKCQHFDSKKLDHLRGDIRGQCGKDSDCSSVKTLLAQLKSI